MHRERECSSISCYAPHVLTAPRQQYPPTRHTSAAMACCVLPHREDMRRIAVRVAHNSIILNRGHTLPCCCAAVHDTLSIPLCSRGYTMHNKRECIGRWRHNHVLCTYIYCCPLAALLHAAAPASSASSMPCLTPPSMVRAV